MRSKFLWLLLAALAAVLLVQVILLQRGAPDLALQELNATVLRPARAVDPFTMVDHRGRAFTLDNLKGKWSFVFFGFTHCPDVCPNTMAVLNLVDKKLAELPRYHQNTQVVFVSIDPERDTVDALSQYVPYFNPAFIGVTSTDPQQLAQLTRTLGVLYMRVPGTSGSADDYGMEHTASILLFNPDGQLQAYMSAPHDPATIAREFVTLRQHLEGQS